jgi:hypothetical protein
MQQFGYRNSHRTMDATNPRIIAALKTESTTTAYLPGLTIF